MPAALIRAASITALLVCAAGCGNGTPSGANAAGRGSPAGEAGSLALQRHWRACIANFTNADVRADVSRDFERGEVRYFGQITNEYDYTAAGLRNCPLSRGNPRPEADSSDRRDPQGGRPDLGTECGMAVGNYEAAYNREMLRRHPETMERNCLPLPGPNPPGLDHGYIPSDIASYRKQMERLYGP